MENKKMSLSKGILDMKFMKRTKERVEKELNEAEGQAMYSKEITNEMKSAGKLIFIETSVSNCKELIEGRLSFGGVNKDIEKIMENEYAKKIGDLEKRNEVDVADADMANYSKSVNNKKFNRDRGGRQKNSKHKKFMKPSNDY